MIIPAGFFNEGSFLVELRVINFSEKTGFKTLFLDEELMQIEILPEKRNIGAWMEKEVGQIRHAFEWKK